MSFYLRGLDARIRPAAEFALKVANFNGITPVVTSTRRSWASQKRLRARFERCVAEGRFPSRPDCRFPANRPGDSAHNWGLAFDSVVHPDQLGTWDAIREWIGFRVPQNDRIHGELPGWRNIVTLRARM